MRTTLLLVVAGVLALAPIQRSRASTLETYAINWDSVPATSSTSKNLTANCICDLTPYACDPGCCCDSDCIPPVTNATSTTGSCLPEGPADETLDYCLPGSYVKKVNLPASSDFYQLTVNQADNKFFDQLLCIINSRDPTLGDSYPDPNAGDVGNNQALTTCLQTSATPDLPTTYLQHTPIYVNSSNARVPLTIPYPAFSEICVDTYAVGFLDAVPASPKAVFSTCVRDTFDPTPNGAKLQQLCVPSGMLSPSYYSNMTFYSSPTASAASTVTISEILYESPDNGTLTPLPANASAYFSSGACYNALASLNLTVYYTWSDDGSASGTATIDKILVSMVVTDLAATESGFEQAVRVTFVQSTQTDTRTLQTFSGNPGYLKGFPVLAGELKSLNTASQGGGTKQAVQRFVYGLPVPVAADEGTCSPTALTTAAFGYNMTSTCTIPLTGNDLATFCKDQAGNPQLFYQALMPYLYSVLANNSLYLGVWGNSNFSQISEWVQVKVSNFPFNNLIYSATDRSCSNVVVGFDLQILTGVAFSANNLQNKVLYANLCFRTATWKFPINMATDQEYKFYMKSTVSYVAKPQDKVSGVRKPAPPLLTPLPEDIFYPFVTSSAESLVATRLWVISLSMVLALLALLLLASLA